MLTSRKDFAKIINDKQYKIAVEIGVGHGAYSEFLLSSCQNIILYSVDPWDSSLHEFRPGSKENTITKLQKFEDRSKILNMKSNEAIKIIDKCDFVYIDGCHEYEDVKNDIELWWNKINNGGMIAGHDYIKIQPGVVKSVNEFIFNNNLVLCLTDVDGSTDAGEEWSSPSWYITK